VDVILQACHSYNIESYKVERHMMKRGLKFLKIETHYSSGDTERIRMRVEALLADHLLQKGANLFCFITNQFCDL
jgi:benzoyl-CoA reductase/2-hydroxyglutaryl-CoA dehydratase subunit BcrC/BadD/HgdB